MTSTKTLVEPLVNADPWTAATWVRSFNYDLVCRLRRRLLIEHSDVEIALLFCQLLQFEFTAFGTDGGQQLTDPEVEPTVLALQGVTRRLRVEFSLPFHDFNGFRTYWMAQNASGCREIPKPTGEDC